MEKAKKIAVIGAGPGGLAAAMVLAHRGFDVTVFEKERHPGGRTSHLDIGPYRFDLGPTFLMMRYILDQLFEDTGRKSEDYLDFVHLDPMYRLYWADGRSLDVTDDHDRMRENLARAFPGNEAGLEKFLKAEKRRFDRLSPCFETDYSDFRKMFGQQLRHALPVLSLGKSVSDILKDYFPSPDAQKAFMFQTKYLGMSPWECPAAFGIIPYVEHNFGIYHVQGGLARIPDAMAKVVEEEGGRVLLGRPVKEVIVEGGKAKGVVLEDDERFEADAVVLNADFAHSALNLFPKGALKRWTPERLAKKRFSCSTFMLYLGLDKLYRDLPHHGIFFAKDYHRNINEIFRDMTLPEDPSFYLRNSSVTDPTVAPQGHSAVYVLVPVPNLRSKIDWNEKKGEFRERVLSAIERQTGINDLRAHIKEERVITPPEWEKTGVHLGATFNLAHNLGQMLWLRPRNRFEDIGNCYLVGGGTHPGSGLPTIFESGRISAKLIEGDLR